MKETILIAENIKKSFGKKAFWKNFSESKRFKEQPFLAKSRWEYQNISPKNKTFFFALL